MKTRFSLLLAITCSVFSVFGNTLGFDKVKASSTIDCRFTENKGQIKDQNYLPRPDVLFAGSTSALNYFIKSNGISYQFTKPIENPTDDIHIYRVDVNWLNVNENIRIEKNNPSSEYQNFYNVSIGLSPALNVRDYESIVFKNIYEKIDLKYYSQNGQLKYDYIVQPGADYRKIQFEIKGAESITITAKGSVQIKTPFGIIEEEAPIVYQENNIIPSKWKLAGNILSFELGRFDANKVLIIDPITRNWGTYYGGNSISNFDKINHLVTDVASNIYAVGVTTSTNNIATSGSHQSTFGGGSANCAFMVKFNTSGQRIWATYYGANGQDEAKHCVLDNTNNIYMVGYTTSTVNISTPGAHQTSNNFDDGFIAKFDTSGVRQWGTYYGGPSIDVINGCAFDGTNLIVTGQTSSNSGIATLNSFGGSTDGFVAQFSPSGSRLWARYFGGFFDDNAFACATDATGNIYICGNTTSTGGISTSGAHQTSLGGLTDAFLAKFSNSGTLTWATYYGAGDEDWGAYCGVDNTGSVYLAGRTQSASMAIATSGSFQPTKSGGFDGYLVKFNSSGARLWGTYFGSTNQDRFNKFTIDADNNIILAGFTISPAGISTTGVHQTSYGGGTSDAMIVSFSPTGARNWASYYGGSGGEEAFSSAVDVNGNIFLAGETFSVNGQSIATTGSHQTVYGGGNSDGFLVKFCILPVQPGTISGNINVCTNTTQTYSISPVPGATQYNWTLPNGVTGSSTTNTINVVIGTNTLVGPNTISVTAQNDCGNSPIQTLVINVSAPPAQPTSITGSTDLCANASQTYAISPVSGALNYTWNIPASWSGSSVTENINVNVDTTGGNFTISVTANNSCGSSIPQTLNVNVASAAPAQPGIISGNSVVCLNTNENYSIVPVPGATQYNWTLPSGWTGTSTSNSINSNVGGSTGAVVISVSAANACGTSTSQTASINVNTVPDQPASISGNSTVCTGASELYSIPTVAGATQYNWTLPSGWTGTSVTNSINTTVGNTTGPQMISVLATNDCGNSSVQTFTVNVDDCSTIGLQNNGAIEHISVYPNPAATYFTITHAQPGTAVAIIDMTGKLIHSETVTSDNHTVYIHGLVNGIYIVQLENNGQISQKKLVINK